MSEAKEVIARALFGTAVKSFSEAATRGLPDDFWQIYFRDAEAVLSALSAAGLVVVPVEPDVDMMQAGYVAMMRAYKTQVFGEALADHTYRAMLAARPAPGGER